jgi:hypothetical protein
LFCRFSVAFLLIYSSNRATTEVTRLSIPSIRASTYAWIVFVVGFSAPSEIAWVSVAFYACRAKICAACVLSLFYSAVARDRAAGPVRVWVSKSFSLTLKESCSFLNFDSNSKYSLHFSINLAVTSCAVFVQAVSMRLKRSATSLRFLLRYCSILCTVSATAFNLAEMVPVSPWCCTKASWLVFIDWASSVTLAISVTSP